jgi:hypothetical protein
VGIEDYIKNFVEVKLGITSLTFEEMCDMFYLDPHTNSIRFDWELWY